ncbi:MAG: DUF1987 domain-containing protein [Bacteroidales bacterium]|nr:DUF1987 domain-containing protein [Bacteroidales bacterium]
MEILKIQPDEFTPGILFDPEKSVFEIYGVSRPENVVGFYKPLLTWLDTYNQEVLQAEPEVHRQLEVNLKMTYFNSASSKFLLDMLLLFIRMDAGNCKVRVNWYYEEDDDEIKESGEELSEMLGFPFNYISVG